MPVARPESSDSRVIAHVDMDCFYVQVEQRRNPHLRGHPTAVVQYNSWKGGALIAVSYEARKRGVKRSMRGDESKQVCPQIQLVQVPVARGKADLSVYRGAGSEVVAILSRKGRCERASIDEVYLDLTEAAEMMLANNPPENLDVVNEEALRSHILGLDEDGDDTCGQVREWLLNKDADRRDKLLACGALIVSELRLQVLQETEFTCSAGIAHNKMLAKLASGMNKPAQQTVVPHSSVKKLLEPLPIKKMKQLGGKLGTSLQIDLGVNTVGDLLHFSEEKLQERYGINTGTWLWNIARGSSGEEVQGRLLPKSHGSSKTFPGPRALKTVASVEKWLGELCEELSERLLSDLEQNKRIAHTLTFYASAFKLNDTESVKKFPSKSCPLRYGTSKIQEDAINLFHAGLREYLGSYNTKTKGNELEGWGITCLSVSASKIVAIPSGTRSIMNYFHNQDGMSPSLTHSNDIFTQDVSSLSSSGHKNYLHSAEQEIYSYGKEIKDTHDIPILDQDEEGTKVCKSTCSIMLHMQDQQPNGLTQQFSSSGGANDFELNQSEQHKDFPGTLIRNDSKSGKMKEKVCKEKGTSSILRFFRSSPNGKHAISPRVAGASSSSESQVTNNNCSEFVKDDLPQEALLQRTWTSQNESGLAPDSSRRHTWTYNIDEIDPSVLSELPPEIQEELRAWLRPHKQAHSENKRSKSTIAHYFLPTKNS